MSKIVKLRISERYFVIIFSSIFFENEPTEICSHLSEKGPSGSFLLLISLKNHTNERKGNEKKKEKERGGRKEEKRKSYVYTLSFYIGYFGGSFWSRKNCLTKDVYLAVVYVTFSKIRKFIFVIFQTQPRCLFPRLVDQFALPLPNSKKPVAPLVMQSIKTHLHQVSIQTNHDS